MELTQEHIAFLEALRTSGLINMLQAGPSLEYEFDLSRTDARSILKQWMKLK